MHRQVHCAMQYTRTNVNRLNVEKYDPLTVF